MTIGNGGGIGAGAVQDNTTEGFIPVKLSGAFENSALQDDDPNEVESLKTFRVPSSTLRFGTQIFAKDFGDFFAYTNLAFPDQTNKKSMKG